MPLSDRVCEHCATYYRPCARWQRFCSRSCAAAWWAAKRVVAKTATTEAEQ